MQRPGDELLVAYLDGELDERQRAEIEDWLHRDSALRDRVGGFAEGAALVRAAFDEALREPVPERLIAAARGQSAVAARDTAEETATIVPFRRKSGVVASIAQNRRWWMGVAAAASLFGLVIGGTGIGYLSNDAGNGDKQQTADASGSAGSNNWLDNIAGYHKLFVSAGNGDNAGALDIASNADNGEITSKISQRIAQGIRLPDLKPWGLTFKGARYLVIEGRPAAQLYYTTDNKAIGPLTIVIASSKRPDLAPTFDHRQDVNLLYWRHHGRAYAIVGQADIGFMWGLANDIGWQMDAI